MGQNFGSSKYSPRVCELNDHSVEAEVAGTALDLGGSGLGVLGRDRGQAAEPFGMPPAGLG
jgi:hypothetical protein